MVTNSSPGSLTMLTAQRVAQRIESRGSTHAWVIRQTGIPRSTLNRRLSGSSPFTLAEIEALAAALDTTAADLIGTTTAAAAAS